MAAFQPPTTLLPYLPSATTTLQCRAPAAPARPARRRARSDTLMRATPGPLRGLAAAAAASVLLSTAYPCPANALPAARAEPAATTGGVARGALVADTERVLTRGEAARLSEELAALEARTGLRVRVLTQSGTGVERAERRDAFGLDGRSVLVVVDVDAGNVLSFLVGAGVYAQLPASFWVELGNRYGNSFYVRDAGLDGAVLAAVRAIEGCATRGPGELCRYVPGVSGEQLGISVGCAAGAGVIAAAALRTGGGRFNGRYLLLFSPLWGMFLGSFGVGPVVARVGAASVELAAVFAMFGAVLGVVWWWIPSRFGEPGGGKGPEV